MNKEIKELHASIKNFRKILGSAFGFDTLEYVYVVIDRDLDQFCGNHIIGIFPNYKKANEYIERNNFLDAEIEKYAWNEV
jgi:hypothetical protein